MTDQAGLRVERGRLKASLTKLKTYVDNIPTTRTSEDIQVRLQRLEELMSEFTRVDTELTGQNVDSEFDAFEDKYLEVKVKLLTYLNQLRPESSNSQDPKKDTLDPTLKALFEQQSSALLKLSQPAKTDCNSAKLPKIELPIFSGDYKEWPSFKDLYSSCVGTRKNLSDSAKLQFLKGALKGEAADLLKHLIVTDANYSVAWDKLVSRYDKKRQIVSAYIKAFINQPSVSSNNLVTSLRRLTDTADQLIRGINVLGPEASNRDPWLIYLLLNKLDSDTQKSWAEKTESIDFPTFESFIEFLSKRCNALETCNSTPKKQNQLRTLHLTTATCIKCKKNHNLFKCPEYKAMNVPDKRKFVENHSLCFNCLIAGHTAQKCKSRYKCHYCKQSHHSSLHSTEPTQSKLHSHAILTQSSPNNQLNPNTPPFCISSHTNTSSTPHTSSQSPTTIHSFSLQNQNQGNVVLLPTALALVLDSSGCAQKCRILLDSGSQGSFISEDCIKRLGLHREKAKLIVHGLSSTTTVTTKGKSSLSLISRTAPQHTLQMSAYILDKLTTPQPATTFEFNAWNAIKEYNLADPEFNISRKIDILIGVDYFFQIIQDGRIQVSQDIPPLQNTIFGYIFAGQLSSTTYSTQITSLHLNITDIDTTLKRFWEIEELQDEQVHLTNEEKFCEEFFSNTHYVDPVTNRYVVRLPFKIDSPKLG